MNEEEITIEDIDKLNKSIAERGAIQEDEDMDRMIAAFRDTDQPPKKLHNIRN